jgi:8-oxo-dGTP pyrophosphatase MutT (NUDIX family)
MTISYKTFDREGRWALRRQHAATGIEVLSTPEGTLVAARSEPSPKRQSVAAFALIQRQEQGQTLYLAQWNLHWRALNLVGGHKRLEESFRECLVREVGEELGLALGGDYEIRDQPPLRLEFDAFSDGAWELTSYTLEIFPVVLNENSALAKIASNPDNRWVTEAEALAGRCNDSTRISPTMTRVLTILSQAQA